MSESETCEKILENITEKLPQNLLICPFCCEEYLFEFTIKNHLRKEHKNEIMKLDNWPINQHYCPYCNAMFYYKSILPKHIAFGHSKKTLDEWFSINDNLDKYHVDRDNKMEPSLKLLDCSPGLSTIFNELETCESTKKLKNNDDTAIATPKSILKKTPHSGKIVILSPESAALRRTINNLKRSAFARRELRFDLPNISPEMTKMNSEILPPLNFNSSQNRNSFWNFLKRPKTTLLNNSKIKKKIREKSCKLSNQSANHIITSTPVSLNFFESNENIKEESETSIDENWNLAAKSNNFKPLFLSAEKFQCNICREKFDSNHELLKYQKEKEKHIKWISFRPLYRCGSCGTKFFRNNLLVRHCRYQHTS